MPKIMQVDKINRYNILTLITAFLLVSAIGYAVSGIISTFDNGVTSEHLNLSTTNITRSITYPSYAYINNLTILMETPSLDLISWWKFDYNTTHSNNLSVTDTEGNNNGILNGYLLNHATNSLESYFYYAYSNANNGCLYDSGGGGAVTNAYDHNYGTCAYPLGDACEHTVYSNYSIHNHTYYSLEIKLYNEAQININVPPNCISQSTQIFKTTMDNFDWVAFQCYNGTAWETFYNDTTPSGVGGLCEQQLKGENTSVEINTTYGKYGKGFGFDGAGDYLNLSNYINLSNALTISFWFNPFENSVDFDTVMGSGQVGSTANGRYILYFRNQNIYFQLGNGTTIVYLNYAIPTLNTWYHIIADWNGTNNTNAVKLYVNSDLKDQDTVDFNSITSYKSWFIGTDTSKTGYFNGSLDNILIYNRSLSQSEVTQIYESETTHTPIGTGLIAQYTGEVGNTTTAYDENNLVDGEWEQAGRFDGVGDYVSTTSATSIPINSSFTLSTWINPNYGSGIQRFLDHTNVAGFYLSNNNVVFNYWNLTNDNSVSSGFNAPNNQWTYVTATYDSSSGNASIYTNGILRASKIRTGGHALINALKIGSRGNGASDYFNGSIDDVMIFNRSLSSKQIAYLYNNQADNYYPNNLKVYIGDDLHYSNSGDFEGTYNLSANITKLNSRMASGVNNLSIKYVADNNAHFYTQLLRANYSYGIDNGTNIFNIPSNATAINFTAYDENNLTPIILSNVVGTITFGSLNFTTNYNNINKFSVYIYPSWANLSVSAYYQYTAGETERYYLYNLDLNNQTQVINIYNFNETDATRYPLKVLTNNYYSAAYPGVIGKLQRFYPSINSWITVQIDQTDANGNLLYYIYLNTIDYKIIWQSKTGEVLYQTTPIKFICEGGVSPCQETFLIPIEREGVRYEGMVYSGSYNNLTGIYSFTWSDSNNLISSVRLLATIEKSDSSTTVCDTNVSSSSGTIICNLSSAGDDVTIRVFRTASPVNAFFLDLVPKPLQKLYQILETAGRTNDGILLSSFIMIAVVGVGAMLGPAITVLFAVFGIVIIFLLQLASFVTIGLAVGVATLGAVVAFMLKR